ncbi:MAG: hypothetical protein CL608_06020 [Anaerolineaceae bacterium]|nr:hypothetical protein [Anaerolineaceae bacterium]
MNLPETDKLIHLGQRLFWLNAAVWLIFSLWSMAWVGQGTISSTVTIWIVAILMIGNAVAFLWCSWAIQKQADWYRYIVIAILGVNILLTFTDQFGIFDFLTLLLDLVLLGLMLVLHRRRSQQWL